MFKVVALDNSKNEIIQQKIDNKTKPSGALGELEKLALQLAKITGTDEIKLQRPTMLVFAADHGIACEGISIAPSEVTQQMVLNFLQGGAAINCFCRINQMHLEVIDAGILVPLEHPDLVKQSLGAGTNNFSKTSAMTIERVEKGLSLGGLAIEKHVQAGCNVFGFGEMGIGNTSSASALMSLLTGISAVDCVGRGTGISDEIFDKKLSLIQSSINKYQQGCGNCQQSEQIKLALANVGGFEIVQMTGAILAAAQSRSVILVDGFIASVAALVAIKLIPSVKDYMVFCHQSGEQGHEKLLNYLQVTPLLTLGMRLGEGTGAALALPLLKAAQSFYNDMASFESAGVTAV